MTAEQQRLLRVQLPAMEVYSWILGERVAAFEVEAELDDGGGRDG